MATEFLFIHYPHRYHYFHFSDLPHHTTTECFSGMIFTSCALFRVSATCSTHICFLSSYCCFNCNSHFFLTDTSVSASRFSLGSSHHLIFILSRISSRSSSVSELFIPSLGKEGGNPNFYFTPKYVIHIASIF